MARGFWIGWWMLVAVGGALHPAVAHPLEGVSWGVTEAGVAENGLESVSGADGLTAITTRGGFPCLTTRVDATPPSFFLYFDIYDRLTQGTLAPIYLVVDYYAEGITTPMTLDYDSATGDDVRSRYHITMDQSLGPYASSAPWKTAVFYLEKPLFQNRQYPGADFRLAGSPLFIRSIRLTTSPPRLGGEPDKGTWKLLSLGQQPGDVSSAAALAVDGAGSLYVLDGRSSPRIEKRDPQGNWSIIAPAGDAPGQVRPPVHLAADAAGDLYVVDNSGGGRLQRRDPRGNWSVLAEHGSATGQVNFPSAVAVDAAGRLYLADLPGGNYQNWRIQARDSQGNWSVVATGGSAPGQVTSPTALAVDPAGHLYVADQPDPDDIGRIQERDARGNWREIAAEGMGLGQVSSPSALAVDPLGNLYVVDAGGIQRRDAQGDWSVLGTEGASGLAADAAGHLYVADQNTAGYLGRIRQRDPGGNWSLIAGELDSPGHVFGPTAIVVDPDGGLFVTDGSRLQQRDAQGNWSVLATAGTGLGQASSPTALALDPAGDLYVADGDFQGAGATRGRIEKRDARGHWSVVATAGTAPGQVDEPTVLAVDSASNLYIGEVAPLRTGNGETSQGRVQERDARGNWSTIAPYGTALGQVWNPSALMVDPAGNLYVGQNPPGAAGRIEKRDTQGNWSVVVDGGTAVGRVNGPSALALDAAGSLYVVDYGSSGGRLQKRDAQGNWSIIAPVGAELGQITYPAALAIDTAGHLYVADTNNHRVLEYTPAP